MGSSRRSLCVLLVLLLVGGSALLLAERAARAVAAEATGPVTIVLQDGTEIIGEIVEERADAVVVKTLYGQMTLSRNKIREIRRENPYAGEFDARFTRASSSVSRLLKLATWAREKGLKAERRRALERVLGLDPDHREARLGLGHARLEGQWVDARKVDALLEKGWIVDGVDLVESGTTGVSDEEPGVERELPPAEMTARKKARRAVARFRKRKEAEFKGVPWEQRHIIRSRNFEIHCNSTRKIAEAYSAIMELLFTPLSKFFLEGNVRSGRTQVFIYATQQQFMDATRQGPGTGAFYLLREERITAYHGTFGPSGTTLATLAHESVHYFQGRKLGLQNMGGRLPRWYIEGMAVYLGDESRIDPVKKRIEIGGVPRDRLLGLQRRIKAGTNEKLRSLIRVRSLNGLQYQDSWAFLHYLIKGPEKTDGQKMLISIWKLCQQRAVKPRDIEDLATQYFGSLTELEGKIIAYVMDLEPDPLGKANDDTYTSWEFKFSIDRPADAWYFQDQNDEPSRLLAMIRGKLPVRDNSEEKPAPGAAAAARRAAEREPRIEVILINKFDPLMRDSEYLEYELLGDNFTKRYEKLDQGVASFHDRDVHVVTFKDRDPDADPTGATPDATGQPAPPRGNKKVAADTPIQKQYRGYFFMMSDKVFVVRGSAPVEDFKTHTRAFRRAAESFRIRLEHRW